MKKLTAREAQHLIDNLKSNQKKEHGISILEEKYLQALEVALPSLERIESVVERCTEFSQTQPSTSHQADNSWVEWSGGPRPVSKNVVVDYRMKDGGMGKCESRFIGWQHHNSYDDIIAYRVVDKGGDE